jgi:hypothetical protein
MLLVDKWVRSNPVANPAVWSVKSIDYYSGLNSTLYFYINPNQTPLNRVAIDFTANQMDFVHYVTAFIVILFHLSSYPIKQVHENGFKIRHPGSSNSS